MFPRQNEAPEQLRLSFSQNKVLKPAIAISVSAGVLYYVADTYDTRQILAELGGISALTLIGGLLLLVGNCLLSSARFYQILKDFGFHVPLLKAFRTNLVSHLAGMFFLHVLGQTLSRSALLRDEGISVSDNMTITLYERIVALAVSVTLCALGAYHLFGLIGLDLQNGGLVFLKLLLSYCLVIALGYSLSYGSLLKKFIQRLWGFRTLRRLGKASALTLVSQLFMAAAYLVVAHAIAPDATTIDALSAIFVVMFVASLPISFGGWGIREISAVYALGAMDVSAEGAISLSILIGLGSLVSLVAVTLSLSLGEKLLKGDRLIRSHDRPGSFQAKVPIKREFGDIMFWLIPMVATVNVFFQVYLPVGESKLNVNLSDPVVLLGAALFLSLRLSSIRSKKSFWAVPHLELYAVLVTILITASYLNGYAQLGFVSWAFVNRLTGWFVLLGYAVTGAVIVNRAGEQGRRLIISGFVAGALAIVVVEYILVLLRASGVEVPGEILARRPEGFSQNPNAFAFQLLVALACLFSLSGKSHRLGGGAGQFLLLCLLMSGIGISGSRAGWITLGVLCVVVMMFRIIRVSRLLSVLFVVFFLMMAPPIATEVTEQFGITVMKIPDKRFVSDSDRMRSLVGGWEMWKSNPMFGSGLGAFISANETHKGEPLLIHNTALWVLAEMGIVGFAIFLAAFMGIAKSVVPRMRAGDTGARLAGLILLVFAFESAPHDMLYQRAMWLLLGAALALRPASAGRSRYV